MKRALLALLITATPLTAAAQEGFVPEKVESKADARADRGWVPGLAIAASFSFAHSRKVVGAQDGATINIGPGLDASMDYYGAPHEWRNSLSFRLVGSKTPSIPSFVKTVDTLNLDSIYLYKLDIGWLGPFAQATIDTSVLAGRDVQAAPVDYVVTELDGTTRTTRASELKLTEPFSPTRLKQVIGFLMRPLDTPEAQVEARAGVGAREVITRNGLAFTDDAATPALEVVRLQNYQQVGAELYAGAKGTFLFEDLGQDRPLNYALNLELMIPVASSIDSDKSGFGLANVEIEGKLGVKIFSWASLDYVLKIVRMPLIVEDYQVQNSLLLNFSYIFVSDSPDEPAPAG